MLKRYDCVGGGGYCYGCYRMQEGSLGDYVRYEDVEPMLKRLAELEAKEQKREQFDRECV